MTSGSTTVQIHSKEAGGLKSNYTYIYECSQLTSYLMSSCGAASNLNGPYFTDPLTSAGRGIGIIWYSWLGTGYSLKATTMKISKKATTNQVIFHKFHL